MRREMEGKRLFSDMYIFFVLSIIKIAVMSGVVIGDARIANEAESCRR